jgi:hypothetical protein
MDWLTSDALASLRSILGDGEADKWEFKVNVFPTPNAVTTRFFVGQTRLVPDTLQVYLAGVETSVSGVPRYETGEFNLATAPGCDDECQASFYYQWFTDRELAVFLDDAASMLSLYDSATSGFTTIVGDLDEGGSVSIDIGIRPSLLQFAAYNAYMRKAAETADSLSAAAPAGYSIDTGKRHPNWAGLAKASMENAEKKLKMYTDNPLQAQKAQVRAIAFKLPNWQPL